MKVKTKGDHTAKPINYGAVFSGEVLTDVVAVNPDREQLIKLRGLENIADKIEEPEYTNININDEEFTKVEFFLQFNPNELISGKKKYEDRVVVSYPIFIQDKFVFNKDNTKIQVIDDHNQNAWIPYEEGQTIKEAVLASQKDTDKGYYLKMDPETSRHAKVGEVNLYEFIHGITYLKRHDPSRNRKISEFVLGEDPTKGSETFSKIVGGDFSAVREVLTLDLRKWPEDGSFVKVGVFLGVRASGDRLYQDVLTSPYEVCIFNETSRPREVIMNGKKLFTRMSNRAVEKLTDPQYPWKHNWAGHCDFVEFTPQMLRESRNSTVSSPIGMPGVNTTEEVDDDLPF